MHRSRIALLAVCFFCMGAAAQQNVPHAGYVYPAGGQRGATFEALIGGQYLNNVIGARVSGEGVRVTVIDDQKPMAGADQMKVREQFRDLVKKWIQTHPGPYASRAGFANRTEGKTAVQWTDHDEQLARSLRIKLRQFQLRRTNPSISEFVKLKIAIAPNAALGHHELRLETSLGVTAPLNFYVGTLPEWSKPAADTFPNSAINMEDMQRFGNDNIVSPPPTPVVDVTLPKLINGQIMPGGVDSYRFTAHQGEHLVAMASARRIMPYIADAVPGWFQASLTLYDAKGKEIQSTDHYSFHPDPVLLAEIPADGTYTLAIHDSIYRGREDFVYRIAVGDLPFVTGMFPLGGKAGGKTKIEFDGWNLPETKLTEHSREKTNGVEMLSMGEPEFNQRPFALDTLPEVSAKSSNHARGNAQKISLPVVVNGRVLNKGESEYFQFKGKAGQQIEAEVYARRLGSPLDSVLTLMDASGKTLAANDDFVDESEGLLTDQADSLIGYKLPADGAYYLCLRDTLQEGGPDFAYRLRVSAPQPDFDLRISPSSVTIRPGEVVPISVVALRHGGFDGDIVLKLKGAPQSFQLSGGVIPGNQSHIRITLSVAPNADVRSLLGPVHRDVQEMPVDANSRTTSQITLEGFAKIRGKDVRRSSTPAEDETQAFFYHHLVTTNDLLITVRGPRQPQPWMLRMDHPLTLIAGRTIPVKINVPSRIAGKVKITLSDPPEGITLERTTTDPSGSMIVYLKADGKKAQAGLRSNLLVLATSERPANPRSKGKPTSVTELMPALPFEVFSASSHPGAGAPSAPSPNTNQR